MTTTALTRHSRIYDLTTHTQAAALFGAADDVEPFLLEGDVWRDMGEPKQITVTIEPGDKLNETKPSCDHPGLDHGRFSYTGICPACRKCKFIGHGPLCGDCHSAA